MIDIHRHELVDQIFLFFSYSFKFLTNQILKDFPWFYKLYFKVISFKNELLRKFACESMSFIIRKIPDVPKAMEFIFSNLNSKDGLTDR